ncbi:zeta toxin family protein [Variovorax fucosicus]|uniref:zeta toxin family protein n=1 Tax=Variovorax fucosicus TaxID=3053517 RepID=UPI002575C263|nr:zeta toxin family protein [Variovorax sp. J22G47]MDM0057604.1 zeta toxin family protein [Variovorax sp. J22G47]
MILLAGPNGAGKSTLYEIVIAPRIKAPFINADLIQREELRDPSMAAAYKAAGIAENRRQQALRQRIGFVSESTFSHPSKLELVAEARRAGFRVVLYHVNVRRPELSVARVAQRVGEGGHDVPEDKIRERYERNQPLIRAAALQADYAFVYDNSRLNVAPERLLAFTQGRVTAAATAQPAWAQQLYAAEIEAFLRSTRDDAAA